MIEITDIDVSYENIQVVWDLSLSVAEDDSVVAVVGPNGAGKTTTLKTMAGLHPLSGGSISVWGDDIATLDPTGIVERGFVLVPEERNLFGDMTTRENLEMGAYRAREDIDERLAEVHDLFPVLEERADQRASTLSGGEQQMLAIGRGLMADPKILALDEPSEGLAPQITERVFERIDAISEDITVLLVEQHVHKALELAERSYLIENGRIVTEDTGAALLESEHIDEAYL